MHKLLERQLKKHFGSAAGVPAELTRFVTAVNEAYEQADTDRRLLERSLDLTSQELLEANAELRRDTAQLEKRVARRTRELERSNTSLAREVAERRAAETALRASEQRYQTLADHSPTGIFHTDADGRILYVNRKWSEITGLAAGQVRGQDWIRGLQPADRVRAVGDWRLGSGDPVPLREGEFRTLRPDGRSVWMVVNAVALHDEEGAISGYVGTVIDVTERRRAEQTIRRSEEKYRAVFEGSKDTIYISTPEGQLVDINPAGVELFGYDSKAEMLRLDVARHLYLRPEDRQHVVDRLSRDGVIKDLELEVKRKNGDRLTVLATATAVRDDHGKIFAFRGILRDVTGQRELERQLQQAQKMEALGRLAGGVAHDFNNLLTAIIGYADLALLTTPPGDGAHGHCLEIKAAAQRGGDLTRQLLAVSRRQMLQPKVLSLNDVVLGMEALLRRLIGEHIELVSDLEPELGAVRADPGQLEQVLLNLVINARDAMPDGGTLNLRTRNVEIEPGAVQAPVGLSPGAHVWLLVEDTGVGIEDAIRDRVFEPFFTTKRGVGSGLGLATVYGIVQQSGGRIELESAAGQGSAFGIYLPRVEGKPQPLVAPAVPARAAPGSETILLVEDEQAVRQALARFLRTQGYRVLTAADGVAGLETARQHEGAIDLLLSDVVMPRMNGLELARRLLRERGDLKVLLMSGYAETGHVADDALEPPESAFLQKPFTTEALAVRLRQFFDQPQPTSQASATRG